MAELQQDIWSRWLLNRRFGGDPEQLPLQAGALLQLQTQSRQCGRVLDQYDHSQGQQADLRQCERRYDL